MKTLSLFAIAIIFAMTSMAQTTTDSSSNKANDQWKQNSDQTRHRQNKSDRMSKQWNNNDSSSTRFNNGLDSNKNYNQDNMRRPGSNMNRNRKNNRMNNNNNNKSAPNNSSTPNNSAPGVADSI